MNTIRFLTRLLCAFIGAAIGVILIIEDAPWFKATLECHINSLMSKSYECCFTSQVRRVSMLTGTIELENVHVKPCQGNKDWSWSCERLLWKSSLFGFIGKRALPVRLILDACQGYSIMHNGVLAIVPHLRKFIQRNSSNVPIDINSLMLRNSTIHIVDNYGYEMYAAIRHDIHFLDGLIKTKCVISKGKITHNQEAFIEKISGVFEGSFSLQDFIAQSNMHGNLDGIIVNEHMLLQPLCLNVKIAGGEGFLDVGLPQHKGQLSGMITDTTWKVRGQLPLPLIMLLMTQEETSLAGTAHVHVEGIVDHDTLWHGIVNVADVCCNGRTLPSLSMEAHKNAHTFGGKCSLVESDQAKMLAEGSVLWDAEQNKGTYATAISKGNTETRSIQGSFYLNEKSFILDGTHDDIPFNAIIQHTPLLNISFLRYGTQEFPLLSLESQNNSVFCGTSSYALIRSIMQEAGVDLPGEGVVEFKGTLSAQKITGTLTMNQAHVKLPYSYNVLHDLSAAFVFDIKQKKLIGESIRFVLHEGEIVSSKATLLFDSSYNLQYGFVPFVIKNCFIGWKKDLFALVSGGGLLTYDRVTPRIEASLLLDRSHVRGNILSSEFQQNLFVDAFHGPRFWTNTQCRVTLATRQPAHVKTSFLNAALRFGIDIKGTIGHPEVRGSLDFVSGSFEFPYQPLYIHSGKIYFLPGQLHDPGIELFARGTIKRYDIGMSVRGTLKQPRIMFESSPMLAEEQIITLLLGGVEDGSLYTVMPTALMHSIEALLFGPADSSSGLQRYLKNLFKPLKNVRIVPSFSDQTGRGGLRGSITIDVNERLRGSIQKNFTLPEDTRVEIEYALSDDTVVRAVKDERGDAGGEIETRWKF